MHALVKGIRILALLGPVLMSPGDAHSGYTPTPHRPLPSGAVPVTGPGCYARSNTTYMLTRDISSPASAVFLGADVVLDLNGYSIRYADGGYASIPNFGFEEGASNWDLSAAPSARIENTDEVQIFIGKKLLRLSAGEEIVSQYIDLPVSDRSYYALCGVTSWDMKVSVYIENEKGETVRCQTRYGDSTVVSCPVENRSPRLGGGFVVAHLHNRPAGRYRVRVRAETGCLVDHIDLRPAMDVGIGIVDSTSPKAHNDYLYQGEHCAFFDYTAKGSSCEPVEWIPRVRGEGTIVIKNGVIESRALGALSWGIQSTAKKVSLVLSNLRIVSTGINTNAVDVPAAVIEHGLFEIDTPFIINRHVSEHAVVLRGPDRSEVSDCFFHGGQGCLTFMGANSVVHHNTFVNRQTVTNHYCIMAMGDGSMIHDNVFEPEIGSGIEIFRHNRIEIYNNVFRIRAAPPTCEYGHEEYSTAAIRIADYGAEPGSERGCADNRVYGNTFHITGMDYPQYPDYIPMAWAFFHSASGGDTHVYNNEIVVTHLDPGSKAEAAAVYIGGSKNGGYWTRNRILTNVPAFWIATPYGSAKNAVIEENTIVKAKDAAGDFKTARLGWQGRETSRAENIEFRSNAVAGSEFDLAVTGSGHSFSVYWTLTVRVLSCAGQPVPGAGIRIFDRRGELAHIDRTDGRGELSLELLEYRVSNGRRTLASPYTVEVYGETRQVELKKNREIVFRLR